MADEVEIESLGAQGDGVAEGGTLYVPFALSWTLAIEYLRRRLDEYPAMMFLVAKNMFLRK